MKNSTINPIPSAADPGKRLVVLLLGAYGMLGHILCKSLASTYHIIGAAREARFELHRLPQLAALPLPVWVDAENFPSIIGAMDAIRPAIVINCIGVIKQKIPETTVSSCLQVNAAFPHELAALCRTAGARLLHFSTDCVFSGVQGGYTEADVPDAEDLYGKSKHLGEVLEPGCLTLRCSFIGRELAGNNGLLEWFLSHRGGTVPGFTKAIFTGFTTNTMARLVKFILSRHPDLWGVWHVASTPISKYELLSLINDKFHLGIAIRPDDTFRCDRSLDGTAFQLRTGYLPPSWEDMIDELAAEWHPPS